MLGFDFISATVSIEDSRAIHRMHVPINIPSRDPCHSWSLVFGAPALGMACPRHAVRKLAISALIPQAGFEKPEESLEGTCKGSQKV